MARFAHHPPSIDKEEAIDHAAIVLDFHEHRLAARNQVVATRQVAEPLDRIQDMKDCRPFIFPDEAGSSNALVRLTRWLAGQPLRDSASRCDSRSCRDSTLVHPCTGPTSGCQSHPRRVRRRSRACLSPFELKSGMVHVDRCGPLVISFHPRRRNRLPPSLSRPALKVPILFGPHAVVPAPCRKTG